MITRKIATGGLISPRKSNETVPYVLSRGLSLVSRPQADAVGVAALAALNGNSSDVVIVEPDGSLTGEPAAVERALAYGMVGSAR